MNPFTRRIAEYDPESGSMLLALMGIIILTALATAGLASIVSGFSFQRHDTEFAAALTGAEEGLDLMAAQVRANPTATSFTPVNQTDPTTLVHYVATATGSSGNWVVTSVGTWTNATTTVTRTVQEDVTLGSLLNYPLFAQTSLDLGGTSGSSGIDTYNSSVDSDACDNGVPVSMLPLLSAPITGMCDNASPSQGVAATDGALTMTGSDINNVAQADIFNAPQNGYPNPDATGRCVGDATTCSSSKVVTSQDAVSYPLSNLCANGIGAGANAYSGSYALAANAVYNFTNVTLNATAIANLSDVAGSTLVICFSGDLVIPPEVAMNATVASAVPLRLDPRAPSTLLLISTANATSDPQVDFGLGSIPVVGSVPVLSTLPSYLSAVIYAPNADCNASGHVDLFGAMVCNNVTASAGLNVHYDTQLGSLPFDQSVTVSHWHEVT